MLIKIVTKLEKNWYKIGKVYDIEEAPSIWESNLIHYLKNSEFNKFHHPELEPYHLRAIRESHFEKVFNKNKEEIILI